MRAPKLRAKIEKSLRSQGFIVRQDEIAIPADMAKEELRQLHGTAVKHKLHKALPRLARHEQKLLKFVAAGTEIDPKRFSPRLVLVRPGSIEELLFRYVSLHWSIPVSSGYGRRLRFVIMDAYNDKIVGILGLADPVFSVAVRDDWIGWGLPARRRNLRHVMDAFVLGAVPPYSMLLCGKLTAMLAASNEVRKEFSKRYAGSRALISGRLFDGRLALVTTTSALGRSSIYNRLKFIERLLYVPLGFTKGSGDFHFSNGLYSSIWKYASRYCEATAKREQWGEGFRNKREVIKKCLAQIGLSTKWLYHGVKREVFAVPLAANTREFLRGDHSRLRWHRQSVEDIGAFFSERWLLPRARRRPEFKLFNPDSYRLWPVQK